MLQNPTPLNSQAHRNLLFKPIQGYAFAANMPVIPLLFSELAHVARQMPIVFPLKQGSPQALVSIDGQHNTHVQTGGAWQGADYVPALLRSYPFALHAVANSTPTDDAAPTEYALFFDRTAPHFQSPQGERLLDDAGQPTALLKNIQQMLHAMQVDRVRTLKLMQQLDDMGLLREDQLKISSTQSSTQGEAVLLKGFRVIDREAFMNVDSAQLKALQQSGALTLVYAHLFSLSLLENGWLGKQTHAQPAPNLDAFFSAGEGSLKFS